MRTAIYIDGFNLYYRRLKGTSYKWLDLNALFQGILPDKHNIVAIKYFTAPLKPLGGRNESLLRQKAYLQAVNAYLPNVSIHYGHFLSHKVRMPNANPPPKTVEVVKAKKKDRT